VPARITEQEKKDVLLYLGKGVELSAVGVGNDYSPAGSDLSLYKNSKRGGAIVIRRGSPRFTTGRPVRL